MAAGGTTGDQRTVPQSPTTVDVVEDELDTRERLLRAAIEVIATSGERAIRVREIAAAAGVTEPSLYHFFGSREGLIIAAQATRYREEQIEGLDRFVAAVESAKSLEDFVAAIATTLTWAFRSERRQVRATRIDVFGSAQSRPQLATELAAAQQQASSALANVLRLAQARGWIPDDRDCGILATWILGQISSRVFIEIDPELAGSTEWNDLSLTAVLAVLGCQPTGS